MHFFTSVTTCYIPKARILAKTLKTHNPDAIMHLVISDELPKGFNLSKEDFDYVWHLEDVVHVPNVRKWTYLHTVVELCTAVKGAAAIHILKSTGTDKIIYLDPDIGVFGSLDPLGRMLDENSVLLTPHMVAPARTPRGIVDEELCCMKYGIYNFGFFAVRNDEKGMEFLNWWNSRLMDYCYDDIPNGMFTDQKWGDIAPALFDFVKIVRDPEYNVATWNLANREVTGSEKEGWKVNGRDLRFYHFTGYDSGAHRIMLALHAKPGDPVWNLSLLYEKWLNENGQEELGKVQYSYACYDNGEKIPKADRLVFRIRQDIYNHFDNPYGDECFLWMRTNVPLNQEKVDLRKLFSDKRKYKLLTMITFGSKYKKYKELYRNTKRRIREIEDYVNANSMSK